MTLSFAKEKPKQANGDVVVCVCVCARRLTLCCGSVFLPCTAWEGQVSLSPFVKGCFSVTTLDNSFTFPFTHTHTQTLSSTLEISTKFLILFLSVFSPGLCLITFSFYSVYLARFKAGSWMQTTQINTIKTHLAMSQNYLSALCNWSSCHILLSTSHSEMTSNIYSHSLVSGLLVPVDLDNTSSLTTLLYMPFLLSLTRDMDCFFIGGLQQPPSILQLKCSFKGIKFNWRPPLALHL